MFLFFNMNSMNVVNYLDNNLNCDNIPVSIPPENPIVQPQHRQNNIETFIANINDLSQIPSARLIKTDKGYSVLLDPSQSILYPVTLFKPHVIDLLLEQSNINQPKVTNKNKDKDSNDDRLTSVSKGVLPQDNTKKYKYYIPLLIALLLLCPYIFGYIMHIPYLDNALFAYVAVVLFVLLITLYLNYIDKN